MARGAIKVIIQQRKRTFALNVFNSLSLSLDFCGILSFFALFSLLRELYHKLKIPTRGIFIH